MSAAGTITTFVASAVVAAAPLIAPSELMLDRVDGFSRSSEPAIDLTFAEYAELEPDSVAHIDPESDAATGLVAAVEVWANATGDELLVVELVRAVDESGATSIVDQAAAVSIAAGLGAVDPPFDGAWSYAGATEETWTETVAWNQGPYAVTLTMLAADETDSDVLNGASVRQVQQILDATGIEVSDAAAVADDAPPPPTEQPAESDEASSGGIPIGKVLLWLVIIGGGVFLLVHSRRKLAERSGPAGEPRSADDIIAEARREAREHAPESAGSTDDIIERARREARAEVDRIDDGWRMPDDY